MLKVLKAQQSLKVSSGMDTKAAEMVTLFKEWQPLKTDRPRRLNEVETINVFNELHCLNALSPIAVTEFGTFTPSKEEQLLKASPMI